MINLHEWEIWHTYSTYIEDFNVDLFGCAKRLVAAGVAEFAVLRDGTSFWQTSKSPGEGFSAITIDPVSGDMEFRLDFNSGRVDKPQGFALEAFGQACHFLAGELRVLGPEASLSPNYLRAFLGKISLISKSSTDQPGHVICIYPVLIVYETGILILELRMIGPECATELATFIADGINLFQHQFTEVSVNPGLSREASRAYHRRFFRFPFRHRRHLLKMQRDHNVAVLERTVESVDEAFTFKMAPLSSAEPETLKGIALTIFNIIAFLSREPREGWHYILFGERFSPKLGSYWSGRPHAHLIKFDNQGNTPQENEEQNLRLLTSILQRVPPLRRQLNPCLFLPILGPSTTTGHISRQHLLFGFGRNEDSRERAPGWIRIEVI